MYAHKTAPHNKKASYKKALYNKLGEIYHNTGISGYEAYNWIYHTYFPDYFKEVKRRDNPRT